MLKIYNVQEGFHDLDEGNYLMLVNPHKIPHLVFIKDGRYYSLTYKGVELGFSVAPYFERLIRTRKPMLIMELDIDYVNPAKVFSQYVEAGHENSTCFYPIKELLLPKSDAQLIFELIPELYDNDMISTVKHFALDEHLSSDRIFELSTYNKADVDAYIEELKQTYAERI